ncbi:hypothetical protein PR202_ga02150 [Eleusine coracana subsp. coracana]|uniref:Uncharacterized protein n=1 Tax=Eleusine coracana subsp. coracana TaxID=191504 RepID=A0AAV5BKY6_ELECO|nr:hypothetical protein PR202_ga02150 [Eleusine coracana subsp. coracana]
MASAAVETLASLPIASPSRSLLRPLPRRLAAAGGVAPSIRISAVPPRGLGFALFQRRVRRFPPAARANIEHDGDGGASGNGKASSAGDGDRDTGAEQGVMAPARAPRARPPRRRHNPRQRGARISGGGGCSRAAASGGGFGSP